MKPQSRYKGHSTWVTVLGVLSQSLAGIAPSLAQEKKPDLFTIEVPMASQNAVVKLVCGKNANYEEELARYAQEAKDWGKTLAESKEAKAKFDADLKAYEEAKKEYANGVAEDVMKAASESLISAKKVTQLESERDILRRLQQQLRPKLVQISFSEGYEPIERSREGEAGWYNKRRALIAMKPEMLCSNSGHFVGRTLDSRFFAPMDDAGLLVLGDFEKKYHAVIGGELPSYLAHLKKWRERMKSFSGAIDEAEKDFCSVSPRTVFERRVDRESRILAGRLAVLRIQARQLDELGDLLRDELIVRDGEISREIGRLELTQERRPKSNRSYPKYPSMGYWALRSPDAPIAPQPMDCEIISVESQDKDHQELIMKSREAIKAAEAEIEAQSAQ